MELTDYILESVREGVGLTSTTSDFDTDLLMHINSSISELNQNGVGLPIVVDKTTTWEDFQDPSQIKGNVYFQFVPLFIALNTKILFDPPPPSSVDIHKTTIDKLLWRLRVAYDNPST